MPPKGYVGIKLTAQRKMMLAEIIREHGLKNAVEAIDFTVAYAERYAPKQEQLESEDAESLPTFINYFVGDATPFIPTGDVSDLTARNSQGDNFGKVSNMTWRMDALNTLRNYEPSAVTFHDAIDFAITATIAHSRSGHLTADDVASILALVRANSRAYKQEVTEFRKDNMAQAERDARYDGTKNVKRDKPKSERRAKPGVGYNNRINALNMELIELYNAYRKAVQNGAESESIRVAKLIDDKKAYIARVTASKEAYNDDVERARDDSEITF